MQNTTCQFSDSVNIPQTFRERLVNMNTPVQTQTNLLVTGSGVLTIFHKKSISVSISSRLPLNNKLCILSNFLSLASANSALATTWNIQRTLGNIQRTLGNVQRFTWARYIAAVIEYLSCSMAFCCVNQFSWPAWTAWRINTNDSVANTGIFKRVCKDKYAKASIILFYFMFIIILSVTAAGGHYPPAAQRGV